MTTIQFTISNIDTEEFSAKRTILKMSLGIILVFDLGKPETLQHLKERMAEITQYAGFIPIILIGTNKESEEEAVMIPSMDIDQFMFKYGINHYFRISTKTGEGIHFTFETMADEIIKETIRKLGIDEVKQKTNFSFAIAMIGDESIKKDWISEFGVQRFAAPSHLRGKISRKIIDRDIHHLLKDVKPVKEVPTPRVTPPAGAGAPMTVTKGDKSLRDELSTELMRLKELKAKTRSEEKPEPTLEKEKEVHLEKPKPLAPLDYEKAEEQTELSPELKSSIKEEVERLKSIMSGESKKAEGEDASKQKLTPPPSGPPSRTSSRPPSGPPGGLPPVQAPKVPPKKAAVDKIYFDEEPAPSEEAEDLKKQLVKGGFEERSSDDSIIEEFMEPVPEELITAPSKKEKRKMKAKKVKSERMRGLAADTAASEKKFAPPPPAPVSSAPAPPAEAAKKVMEEFEHEEEFMEDEEEGYIGYGLAEAAEPAEMEITTEKLKRKTTVFYRERMNPETLNKLAVILSTEKIYEKLKIKIEEVARAATDKTLEIDKDLPIVEVVPEFPGCVCVPSVRKINAEKEYDTATFLITPLQTGAIDDACVKLYHKGKLLETIPTPTKVVKTTAAKVSAGVAVVVPILSQFPIIYNPLSNFLSGLIPLYSQLGELEGIVLILTGLFALISGVFYLFKRPKDAKPVETFPELDEKLNA